MRVMLVDNDPAILRSLGLILESSGHSVMAFADPREAMSMLESGHPPDLLALDLVMPGLDGVEFAHRARPLLTPETPVVLITGHSDLLEGGQPLPAGISACLPKPLDLDRLLELVERSGSPSEPINPSQEFSS